MTRCMHAFKAPADADDIQTLFAAFLWKSWLMGTRQTRTHTVEQEVKEDLGNRVYGAADELA